MPIPTNPNFNLANAAAARRPLYVLNIDGVFEPLTTFRYQDFQINLGGYGVAGYGIVGYGL